MLELLDTLSMPTVTLEMLQMLDMLAEIVTREMPTATLEMPTTLKTHAAAAAHTGMGIQSHVHGAAMMQCVAMMHWLDETQPFVGWATTQLTGSGTR